MGKYQGCFPHFYPESLTTFSVVMVLRHFVFVSEMTLSSSLSLLSLSFPVSYPLNIWLFNPTKEHDLCPIQIPLRCSEVG